MGLFDWLKKSAADSSGPRPVQGSFDPGEAGIQIQYKNFRGQAVTFTGDRRAAYTRKEHLVIRVVPTGRRISLKRSSIQNLGEVESQITPSSQPSPDERRVLNYHLRRGSSSELFQKIRQKYPDYTE